MNKHIAILFLLSLAFTVLSAPVVTTHTAAKQENCSGRKRSPSVSSRSLAPALHDRSPEPDDSSFEHIYRRAPGGIKLCDMNFRGKATSNCRGSKGFINGDWKDHGKFQTSDLECDHILELQLIKTALEEGGFCTAWNTIETKWAAKNPSAGARARMKNLFDARLKLASNPPSDMMWVDKKFNGEKGTFFKAILDATPITVTTAAQANIKAYYNADVKAKAATVAAQVDRAAKELIEAVVEEATVNSGYNYDPWAETPGPHHDSPDHSSYVKELEDIAIKFPSNKVSEKWKAVAKDYL